MKYKKKPVEIDAIQFNEGEDDAVIEFITSFDSSPSDCFFVVNSNNIQINTLEGVMKLTPGNWLIRGLKGEFYPCRDDVFVESYDPC